MCLQTYRVTSHALTVLLRMPYLLKKRPTPAAVLTKASSRERRRWIEQCKKPPSTIKRRKLRRKECELRAQTERLKRTVDKYKRKLQKLKEDCYVPAFLQVVNQASENKSILLEQVKNFQKVKLMWSEVTGSHTVILRNPSARAYEHLRSSGLLRLPY